MTELSPAERATVERFEQAPDALAEVAVCQSCGDEATTTIILRGERLPVCLRHYNVWRTPPAAAALAAAVRKLIDEWERTTVRARPAFLVAADELRDILTAADTTALDHMVAEAADAREAEVRARLSPPVLAMQHDEECDHALGLAEGCSCGLDAAYEAARVAGAAEVRKRVEAAIKLVDLPFCGPDGRIVVGLVRKVRAALAPADNDGGAGHG